MVKAKVDNEHAAVRPSIGGHALSNIANGPGVPWVQRLIDILEKHAAYILSRSSPEGHLGPKER